MSLERYRKQMLFAPIGTAGQTAIRGTRVLLVGCGALGSVIADSLVRAGIGALRIVDRDFVDLTNLQRQVLYDEQDVQQHLPKAVAAVARLRRINSEVTLEARVTDVTPQNMLELLHDCDLILDGTDNFETRFLINDASLETGIPWVSGGVLGCSGQVFLVVPGATACLRCLLPEEPPQTETCDTAGVLGPAVNIIASLQVLRALQWICRGDAEPNRFLTVVDAWSGQWQQIDLAPLRSAAVCPACQGGERAWLRGARGSRSVVLCGRNAVQIAPSGEKIIDLASLELQWARLGKCTRNPFLLWFQPREFPDLELHLFADGRLIVKGTEDLARARTLYSRYLGG
ncbi:MAG: ThiF family adenylyltransferase [Planctomycetaceae bacterium]|nr:ThiF family adenylyltransferase [Planctomycetaceae bacterium]